MISRKILLSNVLLFAALAYSAAVWPGRIKCWTNHQGVKECGNVVPPEYSQERYREISKHGVTVRTHKRAKTRAELEEEKRVAEQRAAAKAEQDRIARQQAFRDRVLLDTYTTEEDLVLAHRGHLATIDSRIKHTRLIVAALKDEMEKLRSSAAAHERAGRSVPKQLLHEISGTERQIAENLRFIETRHAEKNALQVQFESDLRRYRTLKRHRK